jgi:hypothetical protein
MPNCAMPMPLAALGPNPARLFVAARIGSGATDRQHGRRRAKRLKL